MRKFVFIYPVAFIISAWAFGVSGASVDLVIEPDSVIFSDESPMEGDSVTISAVLSNQGSGDVGEDIEVRFIEGEPGKGGLQIGSDALVLGIKAGASGKVEVKWRTAQGETKIYVIADPDNLVKETNENNNTVIKTINGRKWECPKATEKQIKDSIGKGLGWLKSQQGEFYVTCPNGHDNFLYSALAYGKCVICGSSLNGIEPRRVSDQFLFTLKPDFVSSLSGGKVSEQLQKEFENNQLWLGPDAVISVEAKDKKWLITDDENRQAYSIRKVKGKLDVYRGEFMYGGWMAEIGPGMTSLVVMTLLHAGVDKSDQAVMNGIDHLFNRAPVRWYDWTDAYEYASGILALTATGDKEKYMEPVEFATKRLIALQTADGGWGYGAVGDAAHLQYVILGLYAAKQWGVDIPSDTWTRAVVWLTDMQRADGGWNYYAAGSGPFAEDSYGSMTATAVMGLKSAGVSTRSESVRRGIEWLNRYFSVARNPGSFYWHYYYLVSLQRAMDIPPSQSKLGDHDWYSEIASYLISKQQADGSWIADTPIYTTGAITQAPDIASWGEERGDIMASAFAVLFLIRALPRAAEPDVGLEPGRVNFSNTEPQDGEEVTITFSLSNKGAVPVENLEMSFYDGDPKSGGVPIEGSEMLPSLSSGEVKKVSIKWKAKGTGMHRIYAVVDPANLIRESDESNNTAYGEVRVGGESAAAIPALAEIGNGLYKLGNIDLDRKKKTITMYGEVNMSYGLIELLACTRIGKLHESLLVMDVEPVHLNMALILLGLEDKGDAVGIRYQGDPMPPKGDRVRIWVEWKVNDENKRYRAEDLVYDRVKETHMEYTDWVFTGSRFQNGIFMAQAVGTLITTFRDPDTIIDNPLPEGADDTVYIANSKIVPPKGTAVKMIIAPADRGS